MRIAPLVVVLLALLDSASALAEEAWRAEFDRLCGRTEESMGLPAAELRDLAARCDKLKPQIEASADPQKKVFLKRLEACRKVFVFVIEASGKREGAPR
jgi:hypothetical protein